MAVDLPADCAAVLDLQRRVITRRQAMATGLPADRIRQKLRTGRWQPLYRGVYAAFTGETSPQAWQWAAVLRAGDGAALSHHTAAELDELTDYGSAAIHVTISDERRVQLDEQPPNAAAPAIVLHRSDRLETARHPVRTPPRIRAAETVIDLTELASSIDDVLGWLTRGCQRRVTTVDQLRLVVAARPRLRWRREILIALDEVAAGAMSPLEIRYVRGVERAHRLPTADRQVRLATGSRTRYLDNLYSEFGVGVELDGRAAHPLDARWADIHRDNSCAAAGMVILRYSWADVTDRRCATAADLAQVLQRRGWAGVIQRCGPSCSARLS